MISVGSTSSPVLSSFDVLRLLGVLIVANSACVGICETELFFLILLQAAVIVQLVSRLVVQARNTYFEFFKGYGSRI